MHSNGCFSQLFLFSFFVFFLFHSPVLLCTLLVCGRIVCNATTSWWYIFIYTCDRHICSTVWWIFDSKSIFYSDFQSISQSFSSYPFRFFHICEPFSFPSSAFVCNISRLSIEMTKVFQVCVCVCAQTLVYLVVVVVVVVRLFPI